MATKKNAAEPVANPPAQVEPPKPVQQTAVATAPQGPFMLEGMSPELRERFLEIKDNLESVESFRVPRAKMTAQGIELVEGQPMITELEGVIIHTKKTNVYYEKPYNPRELTPPDCFSLDGERPDKSVQNPVSPQCKGCPKAEFGSNSRQSGKACRNLKPIYLLLSDDAIIPRQLTVAPTSLKAANQYLMELTERGLAYRKVRTQVQLYKDNPADTFFKLRFKMLGKLTDQQVKNVECLRNNWRPIMDAQIIDQGEMDSTVESPKPVAGPVEGEY